MPTTISGWCMWLFFLWFGLAYVLQAVGVGFLMASPFPLLGGLFALGYAVFALFGK
ncbi:MAG: hypothetical protein HZB19_07275 [Chloroflexi bacterium]|nr:hypothetical protein [Chloroflexota bacterium]